MSEIKPAITAEEWTRQRVWLKEPYPPYPADRPHANAASFLWGQPFGFTRQDVEMLRILAESEACGGLLQDNDRGDPESAAAVNDLADRIEALLPPEVK